MPPGGSVAGGFAANKDVLVRAGLQNGNKNGEGGKMCGRNSIQLKISELVESRMVCVTAEGHSLPAKSWERDSQGEDVTPAF